MSTIDAGRSLAADNRRDVSEAEAARLAQSLFGIRGRAARLDGEYDANFRLTTDAGAAFVLKIAAPDEDERLVDLQHAVIRRIGQGSPRLVRAEIDGATRLVRLLDYIPGTLLAHVAPHSAKLLRSLGASVASLDTELQGFDHPAAHRELQWDILQTGALLPEAHVIAEPRRRTLATRLLERIDLEVLPVAARLRRSVIHGDANDYNVIVDAERESVAGLIDFGDTVHTATVCDLAIAAAYAMTGKNDPLGAAAHVVAGYHEVLSLTGAERRVVFPLMLARLVMSVVISAARQARAPGNAYYTVHEQRAWEVLEQLADMPFEIADAVLFAPLDPAADTSTMRKERSARLGANLSLSYASPLHIVRGWKQYLYDADGREYLDAYNNVAHVGHSHPRVVAAVAWQMAVLNTNTRYLHRNILMYAERLTATLPPPLRVCYFVNSGSEANELALRLARAHTGARDVIVMEGGYHGNTQQLIDVSPYKFAGPGGAGRAPHVHVVPIPDVYRGPYRSEDAGARYAADVKEMVQAIGAAPAAFLMESLPSVAGQIVPPQGYFAESFAAVRAAGALCIVDEVQVGFGRTGEHFWGFEMFGIIPDIVVMGKPMGNGHPLGAVVTTSEIAASFANGMEYFNTFGGNPVSMAAGLAVLDVLEEESLQDNARVIGARLMEMLRQLAARHPVIGDVRGAGLFIGVELVRDRETREPATALTSSVVNALRERGILTGTEGRHHSVIKIRPPMCFSERNAEVLVQTLDEALSTAHEGASV